ncbi:preprotein translocase subunit SecD [Streptomyces sp. SAI-135]|uniref:SecDF P1 head subdomain-containing protein n=1 Tax=unclassified Streptomyces TaxID=2593676 RepID=UPI002475DC96|nr:MULTISPECIES: hypothetical protein [unclassified Streptomyces]MDH6514104.1 preprotein translocase subunit SecD [Streptomyces sp. SAI-090]MDH6621816.1 preprotein translocase subunit SecD [Streptomyces sp. SAI-135]
MQGTRVEAESGSLTVTGPYSVEQLKGLGALGRLDFRPVLAQESTGIQTPVPQPSPSPAHSRAVTEAPRDDASASPGGGAEAVSAALQAQYAATDCSKNPTETEQTADPRSPVVACDTHSAPGRSRAKYLLGPAVLTGTEVASAKAAYDTTGAGGWTVRLDFTSAGDAKFAEATGMLSLNPSPQNEIAIVVDGGVVSAPYVSQAVTGGTAEISGSFTRKEATDLAATLNSGALPTPLKVTDSSQGTGP